jgi:hypothetical protein
MSPVADEPSIAVTGPLWVWRPLPPAKGMWHFLTIDGQASAEIRYATLGRRSGFGSIRVTATIGETRWQTSIFPHRESGGFILPLKADVRAQEGLEEGAMVTVLLDV